MDVLLRADAVNRLLHFAMATIATFHRVGSCWQERVVEEDQSLFQIGREQLAESLADLPKTPHTHPQFGQFGQGRVRAAAAVEETVNLVHDLAERAQLRQATGDPTKRPTFCGSKMLGNEQMPMLEQIADLPLQPVVSPGRPLGLLAARTIDSTQYGPSYNSSAAMYPEKSASAQSR